MEEVAKPTFTNAVKRSLQRKLLAWFADAARKLPWRGTCDLYAIWVSEIMLQQTQVATVVGYFQPFLARFPTLQSLAEAEEHDVFRFWEGLGYYRRARQLHAAAKMIVEQHGGRFPESFAQVLALPGIGRYTAGAILSIGRDQRLPILEVNTVRVLCRLLAYRSDPATTAGQQYLWQAAEAILPRVQCGNFNQALMELGATVCTPRAPRCLLCPILSVCRARAGGLQDVIPLPKKRATIEYVRETALVLRRADGRVLLRLRAGRERWSGMWDFPRCSLPEDNERSREVVREEALRVCGQQVSEVEKLTTIRHGLTRFRITLEAWECHVTRVRPQALPNDTCYEWVPSADLPTRALSSPAREIAQALAE